MDRRTYLNVIGGGVLVGPLASQAQPVGKVYKLGVLLVGRQENAEAIKKALSERLRELGWHEGRNVSMDVRYTDAPERVRELAATLVASTPDVLIAMGPY